MEYAKDLHAALPVNCRYLPGNHDIGDNPTLVGVAPSHPANETDRDAFVEWTRGDAFAAGHRQGPVTGLLEGPPQLSTYEAVIVEAPSVAPADR